jgi:hypothetical protein
MNQDVRKVRIICGDMKVIEETINQLLPDWQPQGDLIWNGNIFVQKMVSYAIQP